jgi:tetratricopeptide (TPR) repeat protein
MMRKTSFLLCAGVLVATTARAQDQSSPEYVEARQRLQEGKSLYAQGNLDGARLKFEQACAVLKTPACQRALGLADFYTKRYLEALGNLQRALEDKELDTTQRKQITDLMQQAYDKTGHLEVHAPAGGHVRIDDTTDVGNAPLTEVVNVTVGSHIVSVTVEEKTERKTVECAEGRVVKVDFSDRFPSETGGGGPGTPNESVHVRTGAGWIVPIVVGGVGLVGLGLGMGFGLASQSAQTDAAALFAKGICANQSSSTCAPYKDKINAQNTSSAVSIAGYVAGGVFIATAAVLFAVWPKAERQKAVLVPSVSPTSASLMLQGRF